MTYTATVTNASSTDCDVLRFVEHLDPVFDYVSTSGGFGKTVTDPAPVRSDKGTDVVVTPSGVTLAAGKSLQQTFVVKLKAGTAPGTYYDNLELFCGVNGDYASGPLAPVTVPAAAPPAPAPTPAPIELPRTGATPALAGLAVLLLAAAGAIRRLHRS